MIHTQTKDVAVKRDYKSTMFKMIFEDKKKLLELYNAVSGRNYDNPELLTINTLENAIYMNVQNDLSFIIDSRLSWYEHQSTYNPNMPLRFLIYLANLYADMVKGMNLYGSKTIPLPAPKFIVFYNGLKEQPECQTLCLSQSYITDEQEVSLELKVDMLNINAGHNQELMEICKPLRDYSEYVRRLRNYAKTMDIEQAVRKTIEECIREDILRDFLEKEKVEAMAMSIFEYNQEEHMRMEREEFFEDGRQYGIAEGKADTLLEILRELGIIPEDVQKRISEERDLEVLSKWIKLAIKATSIEEFMEQI